MFGLNGQQMAGDNNPQPAEDNDNRIPASRVSRATPLGFLLVGIIIGSISITCAAIMLQDDQLITPRGWIVVCGTTICALSVFLGINGYQHAATRESYADLTAAVQASNAKIDSLTRSRRRQRHRHRKPANREHADLLEKAEIFNVGAELGAEMERRKRQQPPERT